jgi:L-asparaginase II
VVCASHGAEEIHLQTVRSILRKCGLDETALQCGPHLPLHFPSQERLLRSGQKPLPIHNNCSGKHAGMLAACRHQNWRTDDYLSPDHPLQRANLATVAIFSGLNEKTIGVGTDGCGVPSYYLPLAHLATAYARLANPDSLLRDWRSAAEMVVGSMCRHPRLVAYDGHFNTQLLEHLGHQLVAKGGAEGVFAVGIRGQGLGVALKISDGTSRAIPPLDSGFAGKAVAGNETRYAATFGFCSADEHPWRSDRGDSAGQECSLTHAEPTNCCLGN